jgi:prepilin-type N-terminal cleavage/methylation domain-containing protein
MMPAGSQKGYSLTEIMVAMAVIATLAIIGMNYYSNATPKAHMSQAFSMGQTLAKDVVTYFNTHNGLPATNANLAGTLNSDDNAYVDHASWVLNNNNTSGYVEIVMGYLSFQGLHGKYMRFHLEESANASYVTIVDCTTNIRLGQFDGSNTAIGAISPIVPPCVVE